MNRANILDKLGSYTDAINDYKRVIKLEKRQESRILWFAYKNVGLLLRRLGKNREAAKYLKKYYRRMAYIYGFELSYSGSSEDYLKKALSFATLAIKEDPKDPSSYYFRSSIYERKSDILNAVKDLAKAHNISPHEKMYSNEGIQLCKMGMELDPKHKEYYQKQLDLFRKD